MSSYIIQIGMVILGSFGFAIIYNIRGKKIVVSAVGGALAYIVYLISAALYQDPILSTFLATIMAAALAEACARIFKAPVITFLVPMLIPLLPGGYYYYAMSHFVFNEMDKFSIMIQLVLKETAAIAGGIIVVTFLAQLITKIRNYPMR